MPTEAAYTRPTQAASILKVVQFVLGLRTCVMIVREQDKHLSSTTMGLGDSRNGSTTEHYRYGCYTT